MNRLKWKKKQKSKSKIKFSKGGDERSYPASEVRGCSREDIPHTPRPKAVAVAGRNNPMPEEPWLHGRSLKELSHVEGQKGQR